ncbi:MULTISPECIES: DUF6480 family protein [Streptomyces]|nr:MULTISPECIES: DUF6480 family protein [Streptomyces]KND41752.1 membrane protein [Streptomyces stelliscabiei]MDX2521263.1 DUF6480 family protein [Streptomyces stelliscabiei]MDX2550339.1 DUF6480 family protein [Streptomyces stelliscabiei]MDX2610037.1 DUF6480 family protein [Streptomyces stelliscabiei]MDX2635041.1 DUF6480 family protein [Streptomyces stelliscabiei]
MTTPDPNPRRVPGVQPGGGVSPGETPPGEGGTYGISHPEPPEMRSKGWGPMPIVLIMVVAALMAIGLIGMAVTLIV